MSKKFCICRNCGKKFDEKDAIKVERGYKVETHCPKCDSFFINGYIRWTDDIDSEITTEIEPLTETKSELKFKIGDRVFNKVTREWVNIVEFDTETGLYIVRYDDGIRGRSLESEMIEGLVEEETKPNIIEEAKTYWDSIKDAWICPEGYIFKDENGNIINAQKIVLEKKKDISLTQEQINTMVHESCILFCKYCGCGVPRDTCTSLGTCKDHDEYRESMRTYFEKHKK